jgi:hypothetical protein
LKGEEKLKFSPFFGAAVSYLRRILLRVDPSLTAQQVALALVQMCEENRVLCVRYLERARAGRHVRAAAGARA